MVSTRARRCHLPAEPTTPLAATERCERHRFIAGAKTRVKKWVEAIDKFEAETIAMEEAYATPNGKKEVADTIATEDVDATQADAAEEEVDATPNGKKEAAETIATEEVDATQADTEEEEVDATQNGEEEVATAPNGKKEVDVTPIRKKDVAETIAAEEVDATPKCKKEADATPNGKNEVDATPNGKKKATKRKIATNKCNANPKRCSYCLKLEGWEDRFGSDSEDAEKDPPHTYGAEALGWDDPLGGDWDFLA